MFLFCHRKVMFDFFGLHSKLSCDNVFIYGFWSLPFWKNPPSFFSSTCVGQLSWAKDHFPMFCMCWMQALYLSNLKVLKIHFMTIKVVRMVKSGLAYTNVYHRSCKRLNLFPQSSTLPTGFKPRFFMVFQDGSLQHD